ncbi:MAG TPA: helix-hairpin-helix domain-containing protein [Candidatus Polarisedimenticolia bacterium]|nr:helix-hairpin-helix domain-containing protein [Candidatus Polarisedimenticolia bacterium]
MHCSRMVTAARRLLLAAAVASALPLPAGESGPWAAAEAKQEAAGAVDINSATVEELMSVPGIGPSLAQRIVEFREKNGPYKSVDELLKVQGIGEKSLAKIRDKLSAGKARK